MSITPRFFVTPQALKGGQAVLSDDIAHQIYTVLRLRAGAPIILLDGEGNEVQATLSAVSAKQAIAQLGARQRNQRELPADIVLYFSLLKHDKAEWVLQKATELGVARFVPVRSERVVATGTSENKTRRWAQIVREAAEQAHRGVLPVLDEALDWEDALADAAATCDVRLIASTKAEGLHLTQHARSEGSIGLFIGPEGGYSAAELDVALAAGLLPVSLGRRILRAETACIIGVGLLADALERLA